MKKIILAFTSPRRKELLEKLKIAFQVVASDYEEDMNLKLKPVELAKHLSQCKAEVVAKKYKNHIIISADTFIIFGNELLGKPHIKSKAKEMLKKISGKQCLAITGFTIIDSANNIIISKASKTKIYIKKLSTSEIDNYIKSGEPIDKAGAFAVQGLGSVFIEKIDGDFFNIVGLPLNALAKELKKVGVNIL